MPANLSCRRKFRSFVYLAPACDKSGAQSVKVSLANPLKRATKQTNVNFKNSLRVFH